MSGKTTIASNLKKTSVFLNKQGQPIVREKRQNLRQLNQKTKEQEIADLEAKLQQLKNQ